MPGKDERFRVPVEQLTAPHMAQPLTDLRPLMNRGQWMVVCEALDRLIDDPATHPEVAAIAADLFEKWGSGLLAVVAKQEEQGT